MILQEFLSLFHSAFSAARSLQGWNRNDHFIRYQTTNTQRLTAVGAWKEGNVCIAIDQRYNQFHGG